MIHKKPEKKRIWKGKMVNLVDAYNQTCDEWEKWHKKIIDFYVIRYVALQKAQKEFREPERTIVCNILANGVAKAISKRIGVVK